jgi:hypothetical protein
MTLAFLFRVRGERNLLLSIEMSFLYGTWGCLFCGMPLAEAWLARYGLV